MGLKEIARKNRIILAIFLLALSLRLTFMSPWLTDWDSVQFALAIENLDITVHQPHPPGYVLYVFAARILNFAFKNHTLSLTTLSAVAGALSTIPFFFLVRELADQKTAILTTLFFIFTPIHWLLSEVALTNIVGLFFTVLTACVLLNAKDSQKHLLFGSFLAGLTLGFRFAEYTILLSLLVLVLVYRKSLSDSLKSGVYFLSAIFLWLVPLIVDTGINEFINTYQNQVTYIKSHDSFLGTGATIVARLEKINGLIIDAYTPYFYFFVLVVVIFLIIKIKSIKDFKILYLLVWFFSYFIPLVFIYNLEVPRHVLPLLPPVLLLFSITINNFRFKRSTTMIYIAIVFLIGLSSFRLVKLQRNLTPPSIAPVLHTIENFNPNETTLITTFTYRQFQYYTPNFENHWGLENVPREINSKHILTDSASIQEHLVTNLGYGNTKVKKFKGPDEVFPRLPETKLFIFEK